MPKQSGLGDNLYVGGYDLTGSTQSLGSISGGFTPIDVTDIGQSAMDRVGGQRTGQIQWTAFFNKDAGQGHPVLSTLPLTDRIVTYARGTSLGGAAACMVAKQIGYDPSRGADGTLTIALDCQSNGYGLEWGRQLTPGKQTQGSAGTLTSVDTGLPTTAAFGLQLYVHLFAFTGTSITIKVQQSQDDGVGDAYADLTGATTGALTTANSTLRVATSNVLATERYLRVVTTGTFSNAVFSVVAVRNETAVVF